MGIEYHRSMWPFLCVLDSAAGESIGVPLWLVLFVAAGFLLFLFKISGNSESGSEKWPKLKLFYLIAVVLLAIAGIADFVLWVRPRT